MYRIRAPDLLDIPGLSALPRELGCLCAIHLAERLRGRIPELDELGGNRFEKATSNNLKAFVRRCRSPGCLRPCHHIAEPTSCLLSCDATDLSLRTDR